MISNRNQGRYFWFQKILDKPITGLAKVLVRLGNAILTGSIIQEHSYKPKIVWMSKRFWSSLDKLAQKGAMFECFKERYVANNDEIKFTSKAL